MSTINTNKYNPIICCPCEDQRVKNAKEFEKFIIKIVVKPLVGSMSPT